MRNLKKKLHSFHGHQDEVLDVNFNAMGTKLVTASADNTARIYSTMTGTCIGVLDGTLTYSFLNLRS
jgi:dynein assembly factor with WDR repeat domains 1